MTDAGPGVDVVVVGSLNLDLVVRVARLPAPGETLTATSYAEYAGGKGLNQAVAAVRSGAAVAMVGCVGEDEAGAALRTLVITEGIDADGVRTVAAPTGRAAITVDDGGENSIVIVPGANAMVDVASLLSSGSFPAGRVVLAQLETNLDAVRDAFAAGRRAGATTVLNPAPAVDLDDELLSMCSVLVPNEHEVELLGGAERLTGVVGHLIVTRGAQGALVYPGRGATPDRTSPDRTSPDGTSPDGTSAARHIAPFAVTPVDTTGAGDAFCGALAARLARGDDIDRAARYAAAAGALATTVAGAVPSQPHAMAVSELLATGPPATR